MVEIVASQRVSQTLMALATGLKPVRKDIRMPR
jgi:hypothetical protein